MNLDPLAEVNQRQFSPYSYVKNNPIKFIDPDGMIWEDPQKAEKLKKSINKRKRTIAKNSARMQRKIDKGGLTDEVRARKEKRIANNKIKTERLDNSITDIDALGADQNNTFDLVLSRNETNYTKKGDDGVIRIYGPSNALHIHEIKHTALSLSSKNGLEFNSKGILSTTLSRNGMLDEKAAYGAQWAYSPNSVPGSVSDDGIIDWKTLAEIKDKNGNYVYPALRLKHKRQIDQLKLIKKKKKMATKFNNICLISLFCIIVSCATSYNFSSDNIRGVYRQNENKNIHLEINNNSFLFIDTYKYEHLSLYDCCDTIAYGSWKFDKSGFLSLSTPEELSTLHLNMEVNESNGKSNDSLYFLIKNPIENFHTKYDRKRRDISYQLSITSNKSKLDNDIALRNFSSNYIAIKKEEGVNINSFELIIHVNCESRVSNIEAREVFTLPYSTNSQETNNFEIDIPKLDYGYISHKRLENDYVKILNKNKLLWNGKEYEK